MLTLDTDGIRELLGKKRKRPDILHEEFANWGGLNGLKERAKRLCDAGKSKDAPQTLCVQPINAAPLSSNEPKRNEAVLKLRCH